MRGYPAAEKAGGGVNQLLEVQAPDDLVMAIGGRAVASASVAREHVGELHMGGT